MLKDRLKEDGISLSRDRLFDLLRDNGLLIKRRRSAIRTTNSYHRFRTYGNLILNSVPMKANQVWVADITYISTIEGFCYLFLITDLYSRKIVGYHLSRSLAVEGALESLRMALRQLPKGCQVIHHSDRGIQYCCDAYINVLKKHGALISMTEKDHVYENAVAERVNGILKNDLLLGSLFRTIDHVERAVKEAVLIYNEERLHVALGYITPEQKHAA
jgi:putative transposase